MVKTLPEFIELRRDTMGRDWVFICRACGIKERYHSFWFASQSAHDHADIELQEQDEKRTGSLLLHVLRLLRWLATCSGEDGFVSGLRAVVTSRFV